MQFNEAMQHVARGELVQRPGWGHEVLRLYHPGNLDEGVCDIPKVRVMRNGNPDDHYTPEFMADDIQADDWRLSEVESVV